jgi:predicted transcriptional regulator
MEGQRTQILGVLSAGGWWSSMEIAQKLGRPGVTSNAVAATLLRLADAGHVQRRRRGRARYEYAAAGRGR